MACRSPSTEPGAGSPSSASPRSGTTATISTGSSRVSRTGSSSSASSGLDMASRAPTDDPSAPARYADLLVAALDQLGLDAPILLGNSIGATASILCASRRPVRALVLCDSGGLVEITPMVARICRLHERFFAAGEHGARWFGPAFRVYYRFVLTQSAAAGQRRRIAAGAPMRAKLLREAWASFGAASADIRDVAAALAVPIWAAWGDHDRTVPLSYCLPAIHRLQNATVSTFNAGHSPFLEQPDAFTDGLLNFAATLPAVRAERLRAYNSVWPVA